MMALGRHTLPSLSFLTWPVNFKLSAFSAVKERKQTPWTLPVTLNWICEDVRHPVWRLDADLHVV